MDAGGRIRKAILVTVTAGLLAGLVGAAAPAQAGTLPHKMLQLTNRSRDHHGLAALKVDHAIAKRAHKHSVAMMHAGYLYHATDIARYLPSTWRMWGENIGNTTGTLHDLQVAFMHSPEHRANILNGTFTRVGIGVVRRGGKIWITLDFWG